MTESNLISYNCSICNNSGLIPSQTDNEFKECKCVKLRRKNKVLQALPGRYLTSTPLQPYLNSNKDLVIEGKNTNAILCHVKTALRFYKGMKTCKIVNPSELISLAITDLSILRAPDLLVVNSPSTFLHYDNAVRWHENVIGMRKCDGKPTWLIVYDLNKFKSVPVVANSPSFMALVNAMVGKKTLLITAEQTKSLLENQAINLNIEVYRGLGEEGINYNLLYVNEDINKRIEV